MYSLMIVRHIHATTLSNARVCRLNIVAAVDLLHRVPGKIVCLRETKSVRACVSTYHSTRAHAYPHVHTHRHRAERAEMQQAFREDAAVLTALARDSPQAFSQVCVSECRVHAETVRNMYSHTHTHTHVMMMTICIIYVQACQEALAAKNMQREDVGAEKAGNTRLDNLGTLAALEEQARSAEVALHGAQERVQTLCLELAVAKRKVCVSVRARSLCVSLSVCICMQTKSECVCVCVCVCMLCLRLCACVWIAFMYACYALSSHVKARSPSQSF